MRRLEQIVLALTMMLAFGFGFAHFLWPDAEISFGRLHVFLFNLCSGGTLILFYSSKTLGNTYRVSLFFFLSLIYATSAAMACFPLTLAVSAPMVLLTESVRTSRFGFLPWGFFRRGESIAEKFEQAALLCLGLAIIIASLVIVNSEYLGWLNYSKLKVDVFFLGYSFPVSLITMSLMFSFIPNTFDEATNGPKLSAYLGTAAFWLINLGVIIFFVFIIARWYSGEILASVALTVTVIGIFVLFLTKAEKGQQKAFLLSGMSFLMLTAVSGVLYILRDYFPAIDEVHSFILVLHATISLYGWNLSGLLIIIRFNDFPIRLNSFMFIAFHWTIVLVLSPLGQFSSIFSGAALLGWILLLGFVFYSKGEIAEKKA